MAEKIKILVVDDELGIRDMLSYELSQRGYSVSAAPGGQEALDLLKKERFSVAISDIMMPKISGLELLGRFRDLDPDMEVILVTGFASIENAVQGMKSGAFDFIPKPFDLDRLETIINKALSQKDLKQLVGVYESSKAVFSAVDGKTLLPLILRQSKTVLRAHRVAVFLKKAKEEYEPFAEEDLAEDAKATLMSLVEARASELFSVKEPCSFETPSPRWHTALFPLIVAEELLGVLAAVRSGSEAFPFSQSDLRYGTVFASQISQAISNARLVDRLAENIRKLKEANERLEESQKQLVQSEKLAAIGLLSAGIAHELNNPLTGILGFSQILLESKDLKGSDRHDLEDIYKESRRCRRIVENLLKFSRKTESTKEPVCLARVVESALALVEFEFKTSAIRITKESAPEIPLIWGDQNQLVQVFLNLLNNSRQALEHVKDGNIEIKLWAEPRNVFISVSDNGCGIPEKNMNKIFDPFFTTKPVGMGTGLGLSVSYGIVEDHKGSIQCESTEGRGTRMTVSFPIYEPSTIKTVAYTAG